MNGRGNVRLVLGLKLDRDVSYKVLTETSFSSLSINVTCSQSQSNLSTDFYLYICCHEQRLFMVESRNNDSLWSQKAKLLAEAQKRWTDINSTKWLIKDTKHYYMKMKKRPNLSAYTGKKVQNNMLQFCIFFFLVKSKVLNKFFLF